MFFVIVSILARSELCVSFIEKESWRLLEEEFYGDDPKKLHWARHGSKL
jgi:hypothetical protein